jgi:hypothetical protein
MSTKSTIFGKKPKPETSESGNHAYNDISSAFSPGFNYFSQGGNMVGNLLGVNGGPAQTAGLENFANSGGMDFLREQGTKAITSSKAAQGLLNSGSYGTALEKYGQGLASTYLNQYMDNLMKYSNLGLQSGMLVSDAGKYSKGTGATAGKPGLLQIGLQAAAAAATGGASAGAAGAGLAGNSLGGGLAAGAGFSDRRLKSDIIEVGELPDGLKIYEYDLFGERQRGVMADEVQLLRPDAFIPNYRDSGYDGVDYSKIGNLNG